MDSRGDYVPNILADFSFVVVAERSKASDHFLDHLVKIWGGVRGLNFFSSFFSFLDGLECRYKLILLDIQIWRNMVQKCSQKSQKFD